MRPFIKSHLRWAAASLLAAGALVTSTNAARAGGFTPCEKPFVFDGSAANIVPVEYLATSADRESKKDELKLLQNTAQELAWLVKLDSWHQPTYGSLGVVAHLFIRKRCDPDVVLAGLIAGAGGRTPVGQGQVLIMLQGRIFIDGNVIFLQSRLRGFRRNQVPTGKANSPSGYFADEGLEVALRDSYHLRASLPVLDMTFAPRALTFVELDRIREDSRKASIVYPNRDNNVGGKTLRFKAGRPHAFSVQLVDGGTSIKVEDIFGGISGYIRADPEASKTLHASLPELDFLNGLLGFLRVSQAQNGADYPPPPESAARHAQASLARFVANKRAAEDVEARALAYALSGVLAAASGDDWTKAREHFAAATTVAPYRGAYHNLLGVADAVLCCAGKPQPGFADPARAFVDSLSLDPDDHEALLNLDAFLALLEKTAEPPAGIDASRLPERRAVVQKVVSSFK